MHRQIHASLFFLTSKCIDKNRFTLTKWTLSILFLIGSQVGLYIVRPLNLNGTFQNRNYFRAGIGGSKEAQNIDRSSTATGKEQKSSSLHGRLAVHYANWITGGEIISLLVLPRSVINKPSGPTMLRTLEQRREGEY